MEQDFEPVRAPVYSPVVLRSLDEICETFGVGRKRVKTWTKEGAPIVVEGEGTSARYSAEVMQLMAWRSGRSPGRG